MTIERVFVSTHANRPGDAPGAPTRRSEVCGLHDLVGDVGVDEDVLHVVEIFQRLEHLERLLEVAKKRDILVAGYLVPLAPEVRGAIAPHAFLGPFFRDYKTSVTALFEAYEMPLVDAQDASALGFSERAFIDGFHASEVVMAVVVEKFFEDPRVVAKLPRLDRAKLRERIRAARSEALFSFDSAEVLTSRGDVARAGAKK